MEVGEYHRALSTRPVKTMMNHSTAEVVIDDLELPADALIGEEDASFRYILEGTNAERILMQTVRVIMHASATYAAGRSARTTASSFRSPTRTWRVFRSLTPPNRAPRKPTIAKYLASEAS